MRLRIKAAHNLLRLGTYIQSIAVVVMNPDDLIEFSRQSYDKPEVVDGWAEDELVNSGLSEDEIGLLEYLPETKGDLLLLGVGGGREALPLARMGFHVTGLDYVKGMVDRSIANASRLGLSIKGLVQEISNLETPDNKYDVVWLSRSMYSCVPSRERRVKMVKRITQTLRPGGFFLCQFYMNPVKNSIERKNFLKRLIAFLSMGNTKYQQGDILNGNVEFIHAFSSAEEIRSELEEGGLSVIDIKLGKSLIRSCVVCRKSLEKG